MVVSLFTRLLVKELRLICLRELVIELFSWFGKTVQIELLPQLSFDIVVRRFFICFYFTSVLKLLSPHSFFFRTAFFFFSFYLFCFSFSSLFQTTYLHSKRMFRWLCAVCVCACIHCSCVWCVCVCVFICVCLFRYFMLCYNNIWIPYNHEMCLDEFHVINNIENVNLCTVGLVSQSITSYFSKTTSPTVTWPRAAAMLEVLEVWGRT